MKSKICYLLIEACYIQWLTIIILSSNVSEPAIPLTIHGFIFLVKLLNIYYTTKYKSMIIRLSLIMQAIEFGVLLSAYHLDLQYFKVLFIVQGLLQADMSKAELQIILLLYNVIPYIYESLEILIQWLELFSVTIIVIGCIWWENRPTVLVLLPEENSSMVKSFKETISSNIKRVIMKQLQQLVLYRPYLSQERFLVLNHQLESVYDQSNLNSLIDNGLVYQTDQLLGWLLLIKPQYLSKTINSIQSATGVNASEYKQDELGEICLRILKLKNGCSEYYTVGQLETNTFKLTNLIINLVIIDGQWDASSNILLHFQQTPHQPQIGLQCQNDSPLSRVKTNTDKSSSLITNIFSSISHEFGTFLNCILSISTQAMQSDVISDEFKQSYISPIYINSQLLRFILFNLRDYNAMIFRQFVLKLEEFNIYDEIQEVVKLFDTQLRQRNIELIFAIQSDMLVYNDSERFKQVIYQIFANAVRFTFGGMISINISSLSEQYTITIKDTGIGMRIEEQQNLEELLQNNTNFIKVSDHSVGCSLGLSIANSIACQMNNGSNRGISFTSQHNVGSAFSFIFTSSKQLFNDTQQVSSLTFLQLVRQAYYIERKPEVCATYIQNEQPKQLKQDPYRVKSLRPTQNTIKYQPQLDKVNTCQLEVLKPSSRISMIYSEVVSQHSGDSFQYEFLELNENNTYIIDVPHLNTDLRSQILEYKISSNCCSRVLIIDDEYFNIHSLQVILNKYHTKCDYAFNGLQALDLIHKKSINKCPNCQNSNYMVYFIDINMPVMDGFETVRQLKLKMQSGYIQRGLCIANTGHSDLQTKQHAYLSGMDYYLTKPINIKDLNTFVTSRFRVCI